MTACSLGNGSNETTNEKSNSQKVATTAVINKYLINDESDIVDDYSKLGIAMNSEIDELALSEVSALFPGEEKGYIYFLLPADSEYEKYRIESVVINNTVYQTSLLDIEGRYQKYSIPNFVESSNEEYLITQMEIMNEDDQEDRHTYKMSEIVTMSMDEETYYLQIDHEYTITLDGQNFESIYQFNKKNNCIVDMWSRVVADMEQLDVDQRSFFYFAFNCYDLNRKIKFVPEDILKLEVEFNRLTYEYQGENKDEANNITPNTKKVTDIIEPDNVKVIAADKKRSNKRLYEYETINRLDEADMSANSNNANAKVLKQAAEKYDWAVQFGSDNGYPYKHNEAGAAFWKEYDIEYTKIEDFRAISIVYRYEGKIITADTNTLIESKTTTVEEAFRNPTDEEKKENDIVDVVVNPEKSILEKIFDFIGIEIKYSWIPAACVIFVIGAFAVLVLRIAIRRKNKKGFLEEIKEFIEEKLDEEI